MTVAKRNSILILNCPEGTEIFLNFKFFKSAKAFKGFKFVSEDLHLLSLQTNQFSSAYFIKLEPDTVYVLEYNTKDEIFERVTDRKKLGLLSANVFEFDQYLAPVEYSDDDEFKNHVNLIDNNLIDKLPKEISMMSSWSQYSAELDEIKRKDFDLVEKMENCLADDVAIKSTKGNSNLVLVKEKVASESVKYNDPKDFIPFTKIDLKNSFKALGRAPTASEITFHSLDKTKLLKKLSPEKLLQELQLSYLLITLQIWDAFEHFKNILILFSKSANWWVDCGDIGLKFIACLANILKTGKEIWQEVGLDQPNFLESCLVDIFEIGEDTNLGEGLRNKIQDLRYQCEDLFEWSFAADNEEDLPAIVEVDREGSVAVSPF